MGISPWSALGSFFDGDPGSKKVEWTLKYCSFGAMWTFVSLSQNQVTVAKDDSRVHLNRGHSGHD
jgi:hypothetical protein